MYKTLTALFLVAAFNVCAVQSATAQGPGSETTTISLGGALEVEVTVAFESVTNLSLANLGISANVIDAVDLPALLARLPAGITSIPAAFPVLVDITPPTGVNPLSFDGVAQITLRTDNLPYYGGIRLRLFSAHDGGSFKDITGEVSQGSYRVRGTQGEFSEFLIVQEDRTVDTVVAVKLAALQGELAANPPPTIDLLVYNNLTALLAAVDAHVVAGEYADAIVDLDAFSAAVESASPSEIPDNWTPGGLSNNVAGKLRSLAATLRYSLDVSSCPADNDYTDTDLDNIPDQCDNCTLVANESQCDADGDGFGNHCDGDLNDNGVINFVDMGIMKSFWLTAEPVADLNCNGVVNFVDVGILKSRWLLGPGPSGVAP